ncbi:MAG TPA: hypothetical protein VMH86_13925 [Rhizomicrobium sp.]|nr:hypothetical protein [Rhizomicrobium sp.]
MSQRGQESFRQRSGWLIPAAVFIVTAALSALILLYYLAPPATSFIEEHPSPTSRTDPVSLSVNKLAFVIPANYIRYASARQGGAMKEVALQARLPDLSGYSEWHSGDFDDQSADSPIVYLLIREDQQNIDESERFRRIYLSYVVDARGKPGPFGLTQYAFRDDSGYRGEDLFVGQTADGLVDLRCVRLSAQVANPTCLRDQRLGHHVALNYRFMRSHLAQWQDIATGVDKLIKSFMPKAK